MPRCLTREQKNLIDKALNHADPNTVVSTGTTSTANIVSSDDIAPTVLSEIVSLNDYETIYQDIDRYLWDKQSAKRRLGREL